jgi:hypothetical protein
MLTATVGQPDVLSKNYEALCTRILSHPQLTARAALAVYRSTENVLAALAGASETAMRRANASANLRVAREAIAQVKDLKPNTLVQHKDPATFCLATRMIENLGDDAKPYLINVQATHRAILMGVLDQLEAPVDTEKKSKWGLILGITGAVIFVGALAYVLRERVS